MRWASRLRHDPPERIFPAHGRRRSPFRQSDELRRDAVWTPQHNSRNRFDEITVLGHTLRLSLTSGVACVVRRHWPRRVREALRERVRRQQTLLVTVQGVRRFGNSDATT